MEVPMPYIKGQALSHFEAKTCAQFHRDPVDFRDSSSATQIILPKKLGHSYGRARKTTSKSGGGCARKKLISSRLSFKGFEGIEGSNFSTKSAQTQISGVANPALREIVV